MEAPTEATMPPVPPLPPFDPVAAGTAVAPEAEAAANTLMMATTTGAGAGEPTTAALSRAPTRRKRRAPYQEPDYPLPAGIPFSLVDYPELALDTESDHSKLVHKFREPLFPKDSTAALEIAYSHRDAAAEERRRIRLRKSATLRELKDLRAEFHAKKAELLEVNAQLKEGSRKVGSWNKKVFELELDEPSCPWNDKYRKLKEYVAIHGQVPDNAMKTKGTEEERVLAAFVSSMRSKVRRGHSSATKYPHRLEALEKLGVKWEWEADARFDEMFAKLIEYRREHGTFRMPSLNLIKESGDEDLVALHNWVFSQVGAMRYQLKTKKPSMVKRFLDVGFSFERWYATAGHVPEREVPPFDAICRRYAENGGTMCEADEEILRAAQAKRPKRGPYKKRKKEGEATAEATAIKGEEFPVGEQDGQAAPMEGVETAAVDGAAADGASGDVMPPTGTEEAAIDAAMEAVADAPQDVAV